MHKSLSGYGVSSPLVLSARLFHNGILDAACLKLLEFLCQKAGKNLLCLDPAARTYIIDSIREIIKNLCDPVFPNSINDVVDRIDYSFPRKLKPPPRILEEFRILIDKGKKKTVYLPSDKFYSCLKSIYPCVQPSVSLFLTYMIEYTLGQILQWAINYESKIHSGLIEDTDIRHIYSLFGSPKSSTSPVCHSIPFIQSKLTDYKSCAKEIQFTLRSSVDHLGFIVRIFGDPVVDELSQICSATENILMSGVSNEDLEIIGATQRLLDSVKSAQFVFDLTKELYNHLTLLSECVDDVFEDQTRLLGACLLEPAEDETFHTFALYADALFSNDCRNWTNLLTQSPCFNRLVSHQLQTIIRTTLDRASSRRHAELKLKYFDPHSCSLCLMNNTIIDVDSLNYHSGSVVVGSHISHPSSSSSSSSSSSTSSYQGDSVHSYWSNLLTSLPGPVTAATDLLTSSIAPAVVSGHNQKFTLSPSCHSFLHSRQPRTAHTSVSMRKHHSLNRRSVSNAPSTQVPFQTIPGWSGLKHQISNSIASLHIRNSNQDIANCYPSSFNTFNDDSNAILSDDCDSKFDSLKQLNNSECANSITTNSAKLNTTNGDIIAKSQSPTATTISPKDYRACLIELFPTNLWMDPVTPSCNHMVIAFRYLLPQLLLLPNFQLLYLCELIESLHSHTTEESEQEMLKDVLSMLSRTRSFVQNILMNQEWIKSHTPRLACLIKTPLSSEPHPNVNRQKLEELVTTIRRTQHSSEVPIVMSDFIMEGIVHVRNDTGRLKKSERIAFLFTNWLLLCKQHRRVLGNVVSSSNTNSNYVLKLKKRYFLEQFHMIDLPVEYVDNKNNNESLFVFDLEYWETPRKSSLLSLGITNPHFTQNSCHRTDLINPSVQSISSSTSCSSTSTYSKLDQAHNQSPNSPQQLRSQLGSMLSVSTLTSTNTLIKSSSNDPGSDNLAESGQKGAQQLPLLLPTAGEIYAANNTAIMEAICAFPKQRITFVFDNPDDKANWLSTLTYLQLSRLFKRYVDVLPRQHLPLILPSPSVYRFAVPDSPTNIILDITKQDGSTGIPVIRAATVLKLIERMTYHEYFDSKTLNSFLLTYRRYVTPLELLELLVERFEVPDPDFTKAAAEASLLNGEHDSSLTAAIRLEQRFRSVYKRRVQYRVLNFIIKWVKNISYYKLDILPNAFLRTKLWHFLDTVTARNLADNVANIRKSLRGDRVRLVQTIQQLPPETLDFCLVTKWEDVKLINVHPLELARQITMYEWELYSRIEFWEVNGKEKIAAPNFQASLIFSNKIKWWLVYSIMSFENLDDRIVAMQRVADLLFYFECLNNLQGAQEAKAALLSSPVFRLTDTINFLMSKCKTHRIIFDNLRDSSEFDGVDNDYQRKIRQIDPPGLPFIAIEDKTQLIHLELKLSDWINPVPTVNAALSDTITVNNSSTITNSTAQTADKINSSTFQSNGMINFVKCRQLAELIEYYLSFQQTPYNFLINKSIRTFLENLDPLKMCSVVDEHEFDDLMYEKSLRFHPKQRSEAIVVTERQLTTTEQRLAAALTMTPLDAKLTADSREFRNLLQIIHSKTNTTSVPQQQSSSLSPPTVSNITPTITSLDSTNSYNAPNTQFVNLSQHNYPENKSKPLIPEKVTTTQNKSHDNSKIISHNDHICYKTHDNQRLPIGGTFPHRCHHPHPAREARSASSSPAPFIYDKQILRNLTDQRTSGPTSRCIICGLLNVQILTTASPPPLPPRTNKVTRPSIHSEQFVNQHSPVQLCNKCVLDKSGHNEINADHDASLASVQANQQPHDSDCANPKLVDQPLPTLPPRPPRRKSNNNAPVLLLPSRLEQCNAFQINKAVIQSQTTGASNTTAPTVPPRLCSRHGSTSSRYISNLTSEESSTRPTACSSDCGAVYDASPSPHMSFNCPDPTDVPLRPDNSMADCPVAKSVCASNQMTITPPPLPPKMSTMHGN